MSTKSCSTLIKNSAYVNGQWISAKSGDTFPVFNPLNNELIGSVPNMDTVDMEIAIDCAYQAFKLWKKRTAKERCMLLRNWYELIVKNAKELAELITIENGKPIVESNGEIKYSSSFVEFFSEEGKRLNGEIHQTPVSSRRYMSIKEPIGIAGMITPWNFPNAMITRKASPALAVGCTIVIKPAEDTPFSALALCQLAEEAGIPKGVINVVTCSRENAVKVGKVLTTHPLVAAISFTGSTDVGKIVLQQSSSTVKKVSLELGGNAAFIVFQSANIDKAVEGALAAKFRNSGQSCICANRLLVHENIYNEFVTKFSKKVSELKIGNGLDPNTNIGPLINERALQKVIKLVDDASNKGGNIVVGGKKSTQFYLPTVITNLTPDMDIASAEIFAPVAAIYKFKTEEEAIKIANSTRYGLAGFFFSEDISQIWRVAEALEVGMVSINDGVFSTCEAPFGGVKESGLGREGSNRGMEEYVETKTICFGNL